MLPAKRHLLLEEVKAEVGEEEDTPMDVEVEIILGAVEDADVVEVAED